MDNAPVKILLVEDNLADARLLRASLADVNAVTLEMSHVKQLADALSSLKTEVPDVLLLDLSLPDGHGLESVRTMHAAAPHVPIVVLTGSDDERLAVQAVQTGAQDYLVKGQVSGPLLIRAIRYAIERAQTLHALAESERKLRLLAENMRDTVFAYDMNSRLQYVNPALETLTGYSIEELYQQNFINFIHPEDEAVMKHLWHDLFNGQAFSDIEHRIITKEGHIKWCSTTCTPVHEAGRQVGIQGRSADITQRRRAEAALVENEERFCSILSSLQEGLVLVDQNGTITMWNQSAQRILGLTGNQLAGKAPIEPGWRLIAEDSSALSSDNYPTAISLKTGVPQSNVVIGIAKPGGAVTWLAVNSAPLIRPREKQPYAAVATFTDIQNESLPHDVP